MSKSNGERLLEALQQANATGWINGGHWEDQALGFRARLNQAAAEYDKACADDLPADVLAYVVEVETRASAATHGPWIQPLSDEPRAIVSVDNPAHSLLGLDVDGMAVFERERDAQFIANARVDVPALCRIVREQAAAYNYQDSLNRDMNRKVVALMNENDTLRERLAKLESAAGIAVDSFEYERRVVSDEPEDGNEISRAKDNTDAAMKELRRFRT